MENQRKVSYHSMIVLALIAGGFSIALQFIPGWEILAFMLSLSVLGGLIGGSNGYEEQDRQQLEQSYKIAYEWLLLNVLAAYALVKFSRWLPIENAVIFLNSHWPGLILATMCFLMGAAGFQKKNMLE